MTARSDNDRGTRLAHHRCLCLLWPLPRVGAHSLCRTTARTGSCVRTKLLWNRACGNQWVCLRPAAQLSTPLSFLFAGADSRWCRFFACLSLGCLGCSARSSLPAGRSISAWGSGRRSHRNWGRLQKVDSYRLFGCEPMPSLAPARHVVGSRRRPSQRLGSLGPSAHRSRRPFHHPKQSRSSLSQCPHPQTASEKKLGTAVSMVPWGSSHHPSPHFRTLRLLAVVFPPQPASLA
jgi:hypothetical protein